MASRLASSPSRIQSVAASGRPLSKTEESLPVECVSTNGAASRPGSAGSERRVSGSLASRSPIRVPPPGLEKTVRPSAASRPPADQLR